MEMLNDLNNSFSGKQDVELDDQNAAGSEDQTHEDNTDEQNPTAQADDNAEQENQKDKKVTDRDEETANADEKSPVAENTPYSFESISSDVERFVEYLQQQNDAEPDSSNEFEIPRFVERFLDLFAEKVSKYETTGDEKLKWNHEPEHDSSFIESLDPVSRLGKALKGPSDSQEIKPETKASLVNRISLIQHRAMSCLEEEFRLLLEDDPLDPKKKQSNVAEQEHGASSETDPENSDWDYPGYAEDVVANLTKLAKLMVTGGYEVECCQVYTIARRHSFEEALRKLQGFEHHSIDDLYKMQWESLEREITTWINAAKACTSVYLRGERKLIDSVFSDHPMISTGLFGNLVSGVLIRLLNFTEGVTMTKRSAEKLFKFLDIYEALRDMVPILGELLPEKYLDELKAEVTLSRCHIGETAVLIFCGLENSIKSDAGKTPVPGGAVHPLNRYTMNYLKYACEYKDTLEQIFKEHSKIERADSTSRPRGEGDSAQNYNASNSHNNGADKESSPFSMQLMRVMELLDANLESKAKLYRDVSLSCIFMMNNGRYILQKIKGSPEIHALLGNNWSRKRSSDLRQYHKNYQRETWSKLLSWLNHEGLTSHGKVMKPVLKERFKGFNAMFEEIHRTQSSWVVSDEQLQSELRVSISAVVIPAYRSFIGRFAQVLDPGRQTEKYIKFQSEDIENYIDELFDGPTSMTRRRQ